MTSIRVTRLRESVDFERVLAQPAAVANRHFALHGLEAVPQGRFGVSQKPNRTNLSTGDEPFWEVSVDNKSEFGHKAAPIRCLWLGVIVPKRFARRSVTRSLLKRQIRGGVDRHAHALPAGMWVFRLRSAFNPSRFVSAASEPLRAVVRREVDQLLMALANLNLGNRLDNTHQP